MKKLINIVRIRLNAREVAIGKKKEEFFLTIFIFPGSFSKGKPLLWSK